LEVKLSRLLRTSTLPEPMVQLRIGRFRVDYAWPAYRVVCECDGFEWHGDRLAWKSDRRRVAAIEAAGWRIVHATWEDVTKRPAETLQRLALALQRAA
jgi:very-short-patch-repair endonuclease